MHITLFFRSNRTNQAPLSLEAGTFTLDEPLPGLVLASERARAGVDYASHSADGLTVLVAGRVRNAQRIRDALAPCGARDLDDNTAALAHFALRTFGRQAAALLDGAFVLLAIDESAERISVFCPVSGLLPLHRIESSRAILTTRMRALSGSGVLDCAPEQDWLSQREPVSRRLVRNASKLEPGRWHDFSALGTHLAPSALPAVRGVRSVADAVFGRLLEESVLDALESVPGPTASCISGGLDSALVAAIAARNGRRLDTFCIGSSDANEFEPAARTASWLGLTFQTHIGHDDDWLQGFVDAVFYNEVQEGAVAQIQAPLGFLYRILSGRYEALLSGYGADLLSGGMLAPGTPSASVNALCALGIERASSSGELSPFTAEARGIAVIHPFWTTRLLDAAARLPADKKCNAIFGKPFLRAWAVERGYLPREIAFGPKVAVHEGSGVQDKLERIFAARAPRSANACDLAVYRAFVMAFRDGARRDEISLNALFSS